MRAIPAILAALAATALAGAPSPPGQPKTGPGGADYRHAKVVKHVFGQGVGQVWVFEPDEPRPETAPVVVFNHGWMALVPQVYRAWIDHLVRRGNIVVYPRYQDGPLTMPWTFLRSAVGAVKHALAQIEGEGHVRPDRERFAIVGHSAGGALSADMAAVAAKEGLPKPRAVMVVQPGRGMRGRRSRFFPAADLSKVPADTLVLVVVGEDDRVVGDGEGKAIFAAIAHIPAENRDFVVVRTDRHGAPPLVADHLSPCCPAGGRGRRQVIDAIDFYAYWRLLDALTTAAFHGRNRDVALGNTAEQRSMGTWSDGTPVKELVVTDEP